MYFNNQKIIDVMLTNKLVFVNIVKDRLLGGLFRLGGKSDAGKA